MAFAIIELPADGTWVDLSGSDITTITVIHWSGRDVLLEAVTAAPPVAQDFGLIITSGHDRHKSGFLKKDIADLTNGAPPTRVWARAAGVGRASVLYEGA